MFSCSKRNQHSDILELKTGWEFQESGTGEWFPATVPGTVHSDLMTNGLIPDPFIGNNEDSIQWIENKDWIYRTEFDIKKNDLKNQTIDLYFEGLDTYADVYLNDQLILQADNMFIAWEMEVNQFLKEGNNELRIYFHSPVRIGLEKASRLDYLLMATNEQAPPEKKTNVFSRKAPFHFGWDWGPRLVTSGIWQPVYLKFSNGVKIPGIQIIQESFSRDLCTYRADLDVLIDTGGVYAFELLIDEKPVLSQDEELEKGNHTISLEFDIDNPELWWPNGLGDHKLYNLEFRVFSGGSLLAEKEERLGVRKVELVQDEDEWGRSFYFRVNGIPVFMKGANYIPGDILIPRVDTAKYKRVISEAVDANMNMLRVWGGAIYEKDIFYDLCDENGILVWQDFMFACALQPGDEDHLENIRKEAVYNVKRLRNHPSLVLWCGNNENLVAWYNWGWREAYEPEVCDFLWKTYQKIFYEILAKAVEEYDPKTPYWPSSPQAYGNELADRRSGDEHDWTIWFGSRPFSDYGVNPPRFASEYGLQSFPSMNTLKRFASEDDLFMFSDLLNRRQRSRMDWVEPGFNGNHMQLRYIRNNFGEPSSFDDFVYLSQLTHQLGTQEAIEAHRRNMPRCMGSLYWQINDCWPTMSWASVDYFGNWKATHYQAKRSFKDILLTGEKHGDKIRIYLVTDQLADKDIQLETVWIKSNGNREGEVKTTDHRIRSNTSNLLKEVDIPDGKDHFLLTRIITDGEETLSKLILPDIPKNLEYQLPDLKWEILEKEGEKYIKIQTDIPAVFVEISLNNRDIKFSDNYFHLAPGEPRMIHVMDKEIDIAGLSLLNVRSYTGR